LVTLDPFTTLGVDEHAGDEEVKRRYLALVRAFPPDRDPERFQRYRAAFEALSDERARLKATLLQIHAAALSRLKQHLLASAKPFSARASKATVGALLIEGAVQACSAQESARESAAQT
jgi:curved DNA-binding protein CbpA